MNKLSLNITSILILISSLQLQADPIWVPISVGDITTFIPVEPPYVPSEPFVAPPNTRVYVSGGTRTLTWGAIEHVDRYYVQGLDANGNWVNILVVYGTQVTIDSRFDGYSAVRVIACTYNSCVNTGSWSEVVGLSTQRQIIYIHTDLLGSPVVETNKNGEVQ